MSMNMKPTRDAVNEHVLRALSERSPLTHVEYAEIAGITRSTAAKRLRRMFSENKIHIGGYEIRPNGKHWPAYSIGNAPNVLPPRKSTNLENWRRYYDRTKRERPEYHQQRMKASAAAERKRFAEDPEFRERRIKQITEAKRRRLAADPNYRPAVLTSSKKLDEIAMQFGITWRFKKRRRAFDTSCAHQAIAPDAKCQHT